MTRKGLSRRPRPSDIRDRILTRLGVERVPLVASRKRARNPRLEKLTWAMMALEERYGATIQKILSDGTLAEVSTRYGISQTTAWRWRERLSMNDGKHRTDSPPPLPRAEPG